MAIYTTCKCGKTISAKNEHAGKRGHCPACGAEISFPAMEKTSAAGGYDVFISHSKSDRATADALCAALEASGVRCWIAPRDITPGKEWGEAIIDGISQCPVMILIFSSNSNQSQQVRREVERAVSKETVIIPFRIEDVPMTKSMEYFLSSPHWLDALTPPLESHLPSLIRTVKLLLEEKGRPPAPEVAPHVVPATKPAQPAPPVGSPSRNAGWWPIALALGLAGMLGGLAFLGVAGVLITRLLRPESASTMTTAAAAAPTATAKETPAVAAAAPVGATPVSTSQSTGTPPPDGATSVGAPDPSSAARRPAPADAGPLQFAVSSSQIAGGQAVAEGPDKNVVPLQVGKVVFQSSGISVYERKAAAASAADPLSSSESSPRSKRVILIANQQNGANTTPATQSEAQFAFQVSNFSKESITLGKLELHLLGIIQHYEDRIVEPIPPRVIAPIANLEVPQGSGPKTVAEMDKVFADDDTPLADLAFTATSNQPELVQASIVQGRLVLRFTPAKSGWAYISAEAADPFGLTAVTSFEVRVKGPPDAVVAANPEVNLTTTREVASYGPVLLPRSAPITDPPTIEPLLDLGEVALDHRLSPLEVVAPCASGNLLAGTGDLRRPNTIRPFKLRISPRLLITPPISPREDAMVGFKDPRCKLASRPPQLTRAWHVFALSATVTSAAGEERILGTGGLIVLESTPASPTAEKPLDENSRPLDLSSCAQISIDGFLIRMASDTLRRHQETPAYERALLCKSVPPGFDPGSISESCYFSDATSPFRNKNLAPRFPPGSRWPRTNLAESLSTLHVGLPEHFQSMEQSVARLADDARQDEGLRVRMAWLRQKLAAGGPRQQPTASLVRVVAGD